MKKLGCILFVSVFILSALYKAADILTIEYFWRCKDTRENNEIVESSGSHLVLFTPQAMYHFKHNWSLMILADLQVYKYVHGEQLTNSYAVQ